MSQQFCLKWNNHTTNMLQVFENLLTTEALVDVTLACDGLSLKAHKMVLSACSPFFQSLFLENPCKHPIVIMKDMRYCDLKAIIDFMYRGEVNVSHDQLSALLKTAETLKVKGLAEVTGENKQASGIVQHEIIQQNASTPTPVPPSAQRTDTPPLQGKRKRGRPRKRSLSDSNRSDDEGVPPKIKETNSDIEELSGDASMEATSDNRSSGGPISCNSQSQVPIHSSNNVNTFSKSHLSTSLDPQGEEPSGDENEFEVEPSKLLEQTLTTENVPSNSHNSTGPITLPSVSGLEISRRSMSSTDSGSQALVPVSIPSDSLGSNVQGPDSPQDVKPQILSFDDPPISPVAGTSHGSDRSLMMYMDQSGVASIPGPSNFQDNSALVPHDSQPQDYIRRMLNLSERLNCEKKKLHQNDVSNFKCEHCLYVTDKMLNFVKHLSIHIGDKTFDCLKCGEEFHSEKELFKHNCSFNGMKKYKCEFCIKEFGFEMGLQKHLERHTGYQAFSCNYCSKKFLEKVELLRHLKSHNNVKKSDCHLCEKSFREKKDLVRHLQSHTGEKPHTCEECGKKFSRKNDLMRHSRLHTGEKHFNCEYCGKEFYRKDKLKIHIRIHTGEKPFTCEYCGRCFAAKTDMLRHFRLHSSLQCEHCGQNFSSKSSVEYHVCKKFYEPRVPSDL